MRWGSLFRLNSNMYLAVHIIDDDVIWKWFKINTRYVATG